MTREEIINKLREEMRTSSPEEIDWDAVTAEAEIESLGFDSLSILDLIYDVQQSFGITFDAEKLIDVRTVGDLADFLEKELNA